MNFFKYELRRALLSKYFYLALILNTIFIVISIVSTQSSIFLVKGYSLFYSALFYGALALLPVFMPIIASLPAANFYLQDQKNHYSWGIFNRMNIKKYWWINFFVVGIMGAIAIMLPLIILLIINLIIFGNHHAYVGDFLGPFISYFNKKQDLIYILITILHSGFVGFIYANIGFVTSLFVKKTYAVIGIPFILYMGPAFIFPFLGVMDKFEPVSTFMLIDNASSTVYTVYGELIVILVALMTIGYYKMSRMKIWE